MAYMKSNVNFVLLFLIVLSMTGLIIITLYYQKTFDRLYADYEMKMEELNDTVKTLKLNMRTLNETSVELEMKSEREEQLTGKYTSIKEEKEGLATDLAKSQDEFKKMKEAYIYANNELMRVSNELATTKTSLNTALITIGRYDALAEQAYSHSLALKSEINDYLDDKDGVCYSAASAINDDYKDVASDIDILKGVS